MPPGHSGAAAAAAAHTRTRCCRDNARTGDTRAPTRCTPAAAGPPPHPPPDTSAARAASSVRCDCAHPNTSRCSAWRAPGRRPLRPPPSRSPSVATAPQRARARRAPPGALSVNAPRQPGRPPLSAAAHTAATSARRRRADRGRRWWRSVTTATAPRWAETAAEHAPPRYHRPRIGALPTPPAGGQRPVERRPRVQPTPRVIGQRGHVAREYGERAVRGRRPHGEAFLDGSGGGGAANIATENVASACASDRTDATSKGSARGCCVQTAGSGSGSNTTREARPTRADRYATGHDHRRRGIRQGVEREEESPVVVRWFGAASSTSRRWWCVQRYGALANDAVRPTASASS
eukprot:ctg_869.g282